MKTILCFTLTLLTFITLTFVPNSCAQEVKIYLLIPNDRVPPANIDETLDGMISDAQAMFQELMEGSGFGSKTFTYETDASGKAVVHHVNGKRNDAYYYDRTGVDEIDHQPNSKSLIILDVSGGRIYGQGWGDVAIVRGPSCGCFEASTIAHELAHTFGLLHHSMTDDRLIANSYTNEPMLTSYCFAEWLDVHPYFNPGQSSSNGSTSVQMLTPVKSQSNAVQFRFQITDSDGLHQAQLIAGHDTLACKKLNGESETIEFTISNFFGRIENSGTIGLNVIDINGSYTIQEFQFDISTFITPENITFADEKLAMAIRKRLYMSPGSPITTFDIELLRSLYLVESQISDLSGLEYAVNLHKIILSDNNIQDLTPLEGLKELRTLHISKNQISDLTPLTGLTNLNILDLNHNQISDVSPLTGLANLRRLYLGSNQISDVSPLVNLTNLEILALSGNRIQDRTPLATLQSKNPSLIINIDPITIVNQSPEFTEGSNATRKVFEGAEANVNIGSPITATDADNDTLIYTLSGTDAGSFNINSATGQLTTKAGVELDYETKSTYTVTVTVSDAQGNIDIISVTINIQDVNETVANNPPIFSDGSSTIRSITENAETNINIGSPITATDPDSGDSLTYSLSGTDAASFDIDSETGQLTTKAALDFETKNTYTVIITVSDGTLTDTITVTINITDIDETIPNRVPVFTDGSSTTRAIAETTTAGTDIGTAVVATDADGDTLTYTLGGTDAASFDIDTTTGQLKTKATLNFDTKNSYTVDVSVSDGKGGSASITVSINVTEEVEEQLSETETEIEDTTPISESSVQGQVSFSELMFTSRGGVHSLAQWMELYNNSKTNVVHLKEWQLTIEARDANGKHRHVVVSLEDLSIPPNRTALIVTWDARRKSVGFPENRVYNFFNLHFDEFEQNQHRNMVLGQVGFFLKLTDPMGVVIDVIGNLDGDPTTKDEPTWEIPSGTTERGTRTSLMRRYEKDTLVPIDGTDLNSWRRSADFKLLVTRYWGNISDIGNPGYRGTGTLPVTLSLFRAEHTNAGVVLKWTTESEVDNAGFYIYRSTTKDGEFKVINPTIIQGAVTTGERNEYTWTDTTAKLNTVYYYRIEDVSHTGVREQLATVQLQGLVSAADKLTTSWGDLKMSQ